MPEMVFEYILKKNGIDPKTDLTIDQSIDFGLTAAAFTSNDADYTVEFEPHATMLEEEGAGYVLASIYYRSSAQGHWPDQIQDVRAAIRFLRAHADTYHIDPDRIGILGRSAGGQLSAMAAMNLEGHKTGPWAEFSQKVQAACDLFGPVDLSASIRDERQRIQDPNYRWHSIEECHGAALLGVPDEQLEEAGKEASPVNFLSDAMCPLLILHGDSDLLVPSSVSESFYQRIVDAGYGDRADLYILKHAGHGTREFFQPQVKSNILQFFDRFLKSSADSEQKKA